MKLLDDYFDLQQEVFSYFGYIENWQILPLADSRKYYWRIVGGEGYGGTVCFAKSESELKNKTGHYYENEVYTQRHLPRWVYRGKDYTLVVVDTHTDGNQLLQIFSNDKERS